MSMMPYRKMKEGRVAKEARKAKEGRVVKEGRKEGKTVRMLL